MSRGHTARLRSQDQPGLAEGTRRPVSCWATREAARCSPSRGRREARTEGLSGGAKASAEEPPEPAPQGVPHPGLGQSFCLSNVSGSRVEPWPPLPCLLL